MGACASTSSATGGREERGASGHADSPERAGGVRRGQHHLPWAACLVAASLAFAAAPALTPVAPAPSKEALTDTLKADTTAVRKSRADTVEVVKHQFNHRQQLITGGSIMACLAAMMVVMNNYNPR